VIVYLGLERDTEVEVDPVDLGCDPGHREIALDTGMQRDYVVLAEEERAKGFVRPVRLTCLWAAVKSRRIHTQPTMRRINNALHYETRTRSFAENKPDNLHKPCGA